MTIEEALRTTLASNADVNAIVGSGSGSRINPALIPESGSYASITYRLTGRDREQTLTGEAGLVTSRYDLTCWHELLSTAIDLADKVRLAIGGALNTTWAAARSVQRCIVGNEQDTIWESPDLEVERRHGRILQLEIIHDETPAPAS